MATQFLLGVALVWILCGVVTGFVMRRRGHDFFVWLVLGGVLGPLVFPLAIDKARHEGEVDEENSHRTYPGTLDVIVGLDGSDEASQALRSAMEMMEPTSVTLATVLDHDARGSATGIEMRGEAAELLEEVAKTISHNDLRTEVLFGRPDVALIDFAESHDIELIVVGARGHGASEALFGSVTRNLVGGSSVPVFVGSRPVQASYPQMRPD